jgi:3-hydroxyacyl-[acyl-carrier-protein] dehydratase
MLTIASSFLKKPDMLIPDFYTITDIQVSSDTIRAQIQLNPTHEVYEGHFPEQPIVPGVIQLQIVKEILEKVTHQKLLLGEMLFAKYLNMIAPDKSPILTFEIDFQKSEERIKISAVINEEGLVFTKVKAHLSIVSNIINP